MQVNRIGAPERAQSRPSDPIDWRRLALCAETDPEAFFPDKGGSAREALAVCRRCEVRAECRRVVAAGLAGVALLLVGVAVGSAPTWAQILLVLAGLVAWAVWVTCPPEAQLRRHAAAWAVLPEALFPVSTVRLGSRSMLVSRGPKQRKFRSRSWRRCIPSSSTVGTSTSDVGVRSPSFIT
jgi:hypothetical protein